MLIPNTFNIPAHCSRLIEFESNEALLSCYPDVAKARQDGKLLIIGRGSNLLPVGDYDGIVLRSRIMGKEVHEEGDDVFVKCGSGETVDDVIAWCVSHGYYGMENLSLIPGEVGASAVQSIGAYGVEAKDFITSLHALDLNDGKVVEITNAECEYAYRQSRFKHEWKNRFIILDVTYRLSCVFVPHLDYGNIRSVLAERGIENPTAQMLRDVIIAIRRDKLPDYEVEGNAGSFFMNPIVPMEKYRILAEQYPNMPHYPIDADHEKIPAGWMIDQCGWKGRTVGRAGVHAKQALVLVNRGGATGEEVVNLCHLIQEDVKSKFGIEIKPEVNICG